MLIEGDEIMNNKSDFSLLQDAHLDSLISLAYKQNEEEEIQSILEEADQRQLSEEEEALSKQIYAHFLKKVEAEKRDEKRKNRVARWRKSAMRFVEVAACLVLILGILAPFAVANVASIRAKVMELLIHIEEDHADIDFVENTSLSFDVPANWTGIYFPSYIPEGMVVTEVDGLFAEIKYVDSNGRELTFEECTQDISVSLDSADADLSYEKIGSRDAFIIDKNGLLTIVWSTGDRYFILSTNMSKEEGIAVAESVQRIIK